ncbi:MAG: lysylphosphatidylglycerol synthase domain-containing protein [Candidatus Peribacteraceae bacterium]|nr:lysylphosphatidylglycerol synthase domain-containing protein [Candidatus Peribacteraceae bacterium]
MTESPSLPDSAFRRRVKSILPLFAALVLMFVTFLIFRELHSFRMNEIKIALRAVPMANVIAALALTGLNYISLTFYDRAALRALGHAQPYRRIAYSSFVSYAFSYNLGPIGGSAIRTRVYDAWGLSPMQIAHILSYNLLSFWLGFLTIAGVAFIVQPLDLPIRQTLISSRYIGIAFLLLIVAYFRLTARTTHSVRIAGHELSLPSHRASIIQVLFAGLDWLCAVSVLYALLKTDVPVSFAQFLTIYLFAQVAGFLSHVPGGLGVFEFVLWRLLPGGGSPTLIAILLVYRGVYFFMPLVTGIVAFMAHEMWHKRKHVSTIVQSMSDTGAIFAPYIFGALTLIGGLSLLISGAMPEETGRLMILHEYLPLSVVETSHFLGSLTGLGLMLLSYGLFRKLDAAYYGAVVLFITGAVFSLLKGLEIEEAALLTFLLFLLLPCRKCFTAEASLFSEALSLKWIFTVLTVIWCVEWLGIFAHKHVEYGNQLWWIFSFRSDAPRFLRASVGIVGVLLTLGIIRLLHPKEGGR